MKADFWHERWQSGHTGFHQSEPNRYLIKYWDRLNVAAGEKVFVPLCGKSGDMIWLRDQGYEVIGVELSPIAVRDFFGENGLHAEQSKQGGFERWTGKGVTLLCGDAFALTASDLDGIRAAYDRAALIALPPEMRQAYASHLCDLLASGTKALLITIDYPQAQRSGPPFSVPDDEVRALFGGDFEVDLAMSDDVLSRNERFQNSVDYLYENVYVLSKK